MEPTDEKILDALIDVLCGNYNFKKPIARQSSQMKTKGFIIAVLERIAKRDPLLFIPFYLKNPDLVLELQYQNINHSACAAITNILTANRNVIYRLVRIEDKRYLLKLLRMVENFFTQNDWVEFGKMVLQRDSENFSSLFFMVKSVNMELFDNNFFMGALNRKDFWNTMLAEIKIKNGDIGYLFNGESVLYYLIKNKKSRYLYKLLKDELFKNALDLQQLLFLEDVVSKALQKKSLYHEQWFPLKGALDEIKRTKEKRDLGEMSVGSLAPGHKIRLFDREKRFAYGSKQGDDKAEQRQRLIIEIEPPH